MKNTSQKPPLSGFLLFFGIFLLNLILNLPLFKPGEGVYRDSIEGGYASMARFISEYPNPWGWNPTQYCGLPTQFTYLPLLPYLTAGLDRLIAADPAYLYRLIAAKLTCLGPVTLAAFVLFFTKSRSWALATALSYSLLSVSYGLVTQIAADRGVVQLPWRVQALAKYGEGPHNAGLTMIPLALMALWAAAAGSSRGLGRILGAAVLLAAVCLTNWASALALGFCCAMMLLAGGLRVGRALGTAALAYLLACFWLTPTFVQTIAFNWPTDAFNYTMRATQIKLLLGLAAGLLLVRLLVGRDRYLCFLALCFFGFGYVVLVYYWFGIPTIPESRRYALEFELFFFLLLVEGFRRALGKLNPRYAFAGLAALLLAAGGRQVWAYTTQGYDPWKPKPKEETVEYRLAQWLADRRPEGRIFASGGVRFRLNTWFDLPQIGGTFESGLTNRIPVDMAYQMRTGIGSAPGRDGHDAVLQLKALGVEYVVVNGPKSKEHYRDFKNPLKFEGILEKVFEEGDDRIYRLPFTSLAHVVRPQELPEYPPIHGYLRFIVPYVAAIEDPSRPKLRTIWRNPNELSVSGPVPEGMVISLQVSHDPGWKATQDTREIMIERDKLGFMVLRARPDGAARIELRYEGTLEQRAMAATSAVPWAWVLVGLVVAGLRSRKSTLPPPEN